MLPMLPVNLLTLLTDAPVDEELPYGQEGVMYGPYACRLWVVLMCRLPTLDATLNA